MKLDRPLLHALFARLRLVFQESPALQQAAESLIAQGRDGILANFEGFLAKWTGLEAAYQAHGVNRTDLTVEDKARKPA